MSKQNNFSLSASLHCNCTPSQMSYSQCWRWNITCLFLKVNCTTLRIMYYPCKLHLPGRIVVKSIKFVSADLVEKSKILRKFLQDLSSNSISMVKNKTIYPFHRVTVRSSWNLPVQPSVALETLQGEVRQRIAHIKKYTNLSRKKRYRPLKAFKQNTDLNFYKADQGSILG